MPKRRRERDKPKSGPESLYNPNKRVLLSYASDEEEEAVDNTREQTTVNAAEAAVDDRSLANYQMTEYPESDDDAVLGTTSGGTVGASEHEGEDEEEDEDEKEGDDVKENVEHVEIAENEASSSAIQGKVADDWGAPTKRDSATHQWPTLGPVSYGRGEDDEEEYDPETEEAMAYLRAVRSERQNIPEILSAPRHFPADADHSQDTHRDTSDDIKPEDDEGESADTDIQIENLNSTSADHDATNPQKVFTRLLVERFVEQRKQLHIPPSMHKLSELPDSCPISFPRGNNKAFAEWHRLLSTKAPLPAQLRSMDQDTVFNLLGLVQKHYLSKSCELNKITSAWIWSLLARLDDVGTMNNDEVFPLRELGKRVVYLLLSFTSPDLAAGLDILEQEALSIAFSEAGQTRSAPATPPTESTLATLDMMLVVIGKVFGQKDLLEFRPIWAAMDRPV